MRLKLRIVLALIAVAVLWLSNCGGIKLCATGEVWEPGKGCVCKPGHVPDADGVGCHVPEPPTTTTTTTTTSTTTTTTTLPPKPTPSPAVPPSACYPGPWRFHCRFPSCEIQGEPQNSEFERVAAESVKRLGLAGREIPEPDGIIYARQIEADLKARAYCAATHDDKINRLSDDEIGVWHPENPRVENLDFCVASGATAGHCRIVERPFMVARGIP